MNTQEQTGLRRGLSRDAIKYIAMFTMLLNHIAQIFMTPGLLQEALIDIGYFTAPVMCWFLVEGYGYTRSKKRYALRLAAFAALSELPFCLAFTWDGVLSYYGMNMIFTLLICFLILLAEEKMRPGLPRLQIEGEDVFRGDDPKTGAVVLTAHTGCWELLAAEGLRRTEHPIVILQHTANSRRFNAMLEARRRARPEAFANLSSLENLAQVMLGRSQSELIDAMGQQPEYSADGTELHWRLFEFLLPSRQYKVINHSHTGQPFFLDHNESVHYLFLNQTYHQIQ